LATDLSWRGVESTRREDSAPDLVVGFGGARQNACAALCSADGILGICEQERVTRVRAAGFNVSGMPDEALDELLRYSKRQRRHVAKYVVAERMSSENEKRQLRLDHHLAHACAAFLPSPFESATIVICDEDAPQVSVWQGTGNSVSPIEWPWRGPGFAWLYSKVAEIIGFSGIGSEQKMEALARLDPGRHDDRIDALVSVDANQFRLAENWMARIEEWSRAGSAERLLVAAGFQSRLADLLIEFITEVMRRHSSSGALCLGGSLFFNSHFNSLIKQSGVAADVFVPINPGNAGLSVGAALHVSGSRQPVPAFLGPKFEHQETKGILDNCKLKYDWVSRADVLAMAVEDLHRGRLVAWFDGPMEWGPRSLGARSILANPFSPYVLDNLNRFLKHRDTWRGYALSGSESAVQQHFAGPIRSEYMDCDYAPLDQEAFRHVLPSPGAAVRLQTVGSEAPSLFRDLLDLFGKESGYPVLVNTSFNGFQEPIVCNPRDAVRVFFGTGVDTLVIDKFIIRK
jgi:carbamoyltransferase